MGFCLEIWLFMELIQPIFLGQKLHPIIISQLSLFFLNDLELVAEIEFLRDELDFILEIIPLHVSPQLELRKLLLVHEIRVETVVMRLKKAVCLRKTKKNHLFQG